LSLYFIGSLVIVVLPLVLAELMIRKLIKNLKDPHDAFDSRMKSFSFRFYHRSGSLWELSYLMLYGLSGFFLIVGLPTIEDYESIPAWILLLIGFLRMDRVRDEIKRMYSRAKRTAKWEDIELYRNLIERENRNFISIIDSPLKLENLERTTKHVKTTIMFNPKTMENLTSKDEIVSRLRFHLEFLLSDESSVKYTIEDIYVILFMLSEKARFKEFADIILTNPDILQSLVK